MEEGRAKKYISYLKGKKQIWVIVLGALIGGLLILLGNSADEDTADISSQELSDDGSYVLTYTEYIETKIKKLCRSIYGVSDIEVMVSLESGFEHVYANDGEYLIVGSAGTKSPVLLKDNLPEIRGVGIVCKGAENAALKKEICELLCAALDIPSNRIYVAAGK